MWGRGLWKGNSSFFLASVMAVWRLSKELDFFRPNVGPNSTPSVPEEKQKYKVKFVELLELYNNEVKEYWRSTVYHCIKAALWQIKGRKVHANNKKGTNSKNGPNIQNQNIKNIKGGI